MTNGSSSGLKLYTQRGKGYTLPFPSDLSVEVGKVSILRLLEWLQAVCWGWVSVNGFLCSWFSKLPFSISSCLCCSGKSLPTVTLILEGQCPICEQGATSLLKHKDKTGHIFQLVTCYITTEINLCMKGMIREYQNKVIGKYLTSL